MYPSKNANPDFDRNRSTLSPASMTTGSPTDLTLPDFRKSSEIQQAFQRLADRKTSPFSISAIGADRRTVSGSTTIQRASIGTLGNATVDDTKYDNSSWGNISTHLAGEWDKSNTSTPTGGHVLNAMTAKWGDAHANVPNVRNNKTDESGVYFTGAQPSANKISGTTYNYFLVDKPDNGQKKQSNTKTSSFWPKNWGTENLKTVLDNSHMTNKTDIYASKAITNYWFTWHSLGNATAYPLARFSKMG
jgi:hypothetical protein